MYYVMHSLFNSSYQSFSYINMIKRVYYVYDSFLKIVLHTLELSILICKSYFETTSLVQSSHIQ
jgi:hypothetical protein